jgi:putative transcriptional regulator
MHGRAKAFGALLAALCLPVQFSGTCTTRTAQYSPEERLSIGKILVANEKLGDPNFAQSVILIVQFDREVGTVGLIINRQTEIPVSRVFPKVKQAAKDPVYMGGPLEITGVQALLRLPEKTNQAMHVTGDTYVTGNQELIEKSVASQIDPSKFRLYLGYAGWARGQLEAEIQVGAWSLISGDAGTIFDRNPESLWSRLNQSQIAAASLRSLWNSRPASRDGAGSLLLCVSPDQKIRHNSRALSSMLPVHPSCPAREKMCFAC